MLKDAIIKAGLHMAGRAGVDKLFAAPGVRGAIIMLHRVRPRMNEAFQPNKLLEIEPQLLDESLRLLKEAGHRFATMDDVPRLLQGPRGERFVVVTSDDGYRDNIEHALPVLKRHQCPMTIYLTTGYAKGDARLWWIELEEAVRRLDVIEIEVAGEITRLETRTIAQKNLAFDACLARLRPDSVMREQVAALAAKAGVDAAEIVRNACLTKDEIAGIARTEPLISFGAHTLNHLRLKHHAESVVVRELVDSKAELADWFGAPVDHVAYPFGDDDSAGEREFRIAQAAGYATGVTTEGGVLDDRSARDMWALPRVFVSGVSLTAHGLRFKVSGIPFYVRDIFARRA